MALPAPLLEALSDFTEGAAHPRSPGDQALELKKRSDHLRKILARLEQDAVALGSRCENLDEIIDFLEQKEQEGKGIAPQRYEAILTETLEALRDTRWRLMATRAEIEDPGDADVYDNPSDLLKSLTGTR